MEWRVGWSSSMVESDLGGGHKKFPLGPTLLGVVWALGNKETSSALRLVARMTRVLFPGSQDVTHGGCGVAYVFVGDSFLDGRSAYQTLA